MHMLQLKTAVLAVVFFFVCGTTKAQKSASAPGTTFKKEVLRSIDLKERNDTRMPPVKNGSTDTSLMEMLVDAIRSGKLTAYSISFNNSIAKLSSQELD